MYSVRFLVHVDGRTFIRREGVPLVPQAGFFYRRSGIEMQVTKTIWDADSIVFECWLAGTDKNAQALLDVGWQHWDGIPY